MEEKNKTQTYKYDDYIKVIMDSSPLGTLIFDNSFEPIFCNEILANIFGLRTSKEFLDNFYKLIPQTQPDGSNSLYIMKKTLTEVLKVGKLKGNWTGINLTGEPISTDVYILKVHYKNKDILVVRFEDQSKLKEIKIAQKRVQLMFDQSPICANFWNKDLINIDCNKKAIELFELNKKEEYLDRFLELSPKYQPNGEISSKLAKKKINAAFKEGVCEFEWMHQKFNGEQIPSRIILMKTFFNNEEALIGYTFDLRKEKEMLKELKVKENELIQAKIIAEHNSKIKSEFISNMSHEIRTPMNGILSLLDILTETKLDSTQESFVNQATLCANELLEILNEILDFTKIESGKFDIEKTPFNIYDVYKDIQNLFDERIREQKLDFYVDELKYSPLKVLGDPKKIKQVVSNIIRNSIKFTHKGSIRFSIKEIMQNNESVSYQFEIKDTGIGISNKALKNILNPFVQFDSSMTRSYGGIGLGLSISKSIIEKMGGKIWIESVLNEGTTVFLSIKLPLEKNISSYKLNSSNSKYSNLEYLC